VHIVEFVGSKLNRSESDDGKYIAAVQEAVNDYVSFTGFKRDPRYNAILEHTSIQHGQECLEIILSQSPDFLLRIDDFRNDLEGGATTNKYPFIGEISPSTLRYMKVASDIRAIFGKTEFDIVAEVGVGYGGQLLVNDEVFGFDGYHLFDLPPVLNLASRYLECHVLNNCYKTSTLNRHDCHVNYDLAISNYAFSELPSLLQRKYIEKIFSRSQRGYLTMNSGLPNSAFRQDKLSVDELRDLLPRFNIIEERPLTGPNNYIITWGV